MNKPTINEEILKILQEEIADRVIYESRSAEETLRRGLQSAETRLGILLLSALRRQAEGILKGVEEKKTTIVTDYNEVIEVIFPNDVRESIEPLTK